MATTRSRSRRARPGLHRSPSKFEATVVQGLTPLAVFGHGVGPLGDDAAGLGAIIVATKSTDFVHASTLAELAITRIVRPRKGPEEEELSIRPILGLCLFATRKVILCLL